MESIADHLPAAARTVKAEDILVEIERQMNGQTLGAIYRDRVLTQRTRQFELRVPARRGNVEILHTLLGIELKVGNRRILCPDLATARYLSVFARLGCETVAVPYDITQVSRIADELESSFHRMMLLIEHLTTGRSARLRAIVRRRLLEDQRQIVSRLGAGTKYPKFNQNTRQRKPPFPR